MKASHIERHQSLLHTKISEELIISTLKVLSTSPRRLFVDNGRHE